jgi:hypothetical protein
MLMTREVTDLMDHYRVVARSVWNTGFWLVPELRNWDSRERFEEIKRLLFRKLVSERLEQPDEPQAKGCDYRVVPVGTGPVPIMIHQPRQADRNLYWDDPIREIRASESELCFLDYFDWDEMTYIDFQYYRVRIQAFASQPQLVGREALLQHHDAKVFVSS